ncbi:uncharacterized protein TM35_000092340 [Trypanosoma theileri]|uniref:Uncharacterized protein n=1 Tax=Trypanosoma theileri TaxID=67003 RepID=A0A1X0NZR3_9TRYP|nr:uncharacterized protein TM35_000092340 [Trypanosoma theileri]ORC90184.1 hypothetical protein TM35_000092340 [Trypanosoma theileri]
MPTEDTLFLPKRVAAGLLAIFCGFALGVLQSLDFVKLFTYIRANANLRRTLQSCLIVNAVFFSSLWITSLLIYPMLTFGGGVVWGGSGNATTTTATTTTTTTTTTSVGTAINISNTVMNGSKKPTRAIEAAKSGVGLVSKLWFPVFDAMWVLPVYALIQALGLRWYNALYVEAYKEKKRRAAVGATRGTVEGHCKGEETSSPTKVRSTDGPPSFHTAVVSLSEIMFKFLVTTVYAIVSVVVEMIIPSPMGSHIAFMMNSWLYAFYVFDYRLSSQYVVDRRTRQQNRLTLSSVLKLFETNWAYFLGFGVSQSIITTTLRSSWMAFSWYSVAAVTSVLFGAHVVLSVEATPSPRAPFAVPMLTPFFALCGVVLRKIANAML